MIFDIVYTIGNLEHCVGVPGVVKKYCDETLCCCGDTSMHCTVQYCVVGACTGEKLERCKRHTPSTALGGESNCAGTGFLLFLPVLGSSGETGFSYSRGGVSCRECKCKRWLLGGYTTSRTSNGWAMDSPRPFGSLHSPIVTLGFAGTWEEDTTAGQ